MNFFKLVIFYIILISIGNIKDLKADTLNQNQIPGYYCVIPNLVKSLSKTEDKISLLQYKRAWASALLGQDFYLKKATQILRGGSIDCLDPLYKYLRPKDQKIVSNFQRKIKINRNKVFHKKDRAKMRIAENYIVRSLVTKMNAYKKVKDILIEYSNEVGPQLVSAPAIKGNTIKFNLHKGVAKVVTNIFSAAKNTSSSHGHIVFNNQLEKDMITHVYSEEAILVGLRLFGFKESITPNMALPYLKAIYKTIIDTSFNKLRGKRPKFHIDLSKSGNTLAYYSPQQNTIHLTVSGINQSKHEMRKTILHELAHWIWFRVLSLQTKLHYARIHWRPKDEAWIYHPKNKKDKNRHGKGPLKDPIAVREHLNWKKWHLKTNRILITDYARKDVMEHFAEYLSYMITEPDKVQRNYPKIYQAFKNYFRAEFQTINLLAALKGKTKIADPSSKSIGKRPILFEDLSPKDITVKFVKRDPNFIQYKVQVEIRVKKGRSWTDQSFDIGVPCLFASGFGVNNTSKVTFDNLLFVTKSDCRETKMKNKWLCTLNYSFPIIPTSDGPKLLHNNHILFYQYRGNSMLTDHNYCRDIPRDKIVINYQGSDSTKTVQINNPFKFKKVADEFKLNEGSFTNETKNILRKISSLTASDFEIIRPSIPYINKKYLIRPKGKIWKELRKFGGKILAIRLSHMTFQRSQKVWRPFQLSQIEYSPLDLSGLKKLMVTSLRKRKISDSIPLPERRTSFYRLRAHIELVITTPSYLLQNRIKLTLPDLVDSKSVLMGPATLYPNFLKYKKKTTLTAGLKSKDVGDFLYHGGSYFRLSLGSSTSINGTQDPVFRYFKGSKNKFKILERADPNNADFQHYFLDPQNRIRKDNFIKSGTDTNGHKFRQNIVNLQDNDIDAPKYLSITNLKGNHAATFSSRTYPNSVHLFSFLGFKKGSYIIGDALRADYNFRMTNIKKKVQKIK